MPPRRRELMPDKMLVQPRLRFQPRPYARQDTRITMIATTAKVCGVEEQKILQRIRQGSLPHEVDWTEPSRLVLDLS